MIYVMSDIHGTYQKYRKMLEEIHFGQDDILYLLGDCMDRGEEGIEVMQDVMSRDNVVLLMGNHEDLALPCLRHFIYPELDDGKFEEDWELWEYNGGFETLKGFLQLDESEQKRIYAFIKELPLYKELEINGYRFFLSHSVKPYNGYLDLNSLTKEDYIWGRQNYANRYDKERILITGHTPTAIIDSRYLGRMFFGNANIAIDCGAVFEEQGGRLGCLCLDTLDEYYV